MTDRKNKYKEYETWEFGLEKRFGKWQAFGITNYVMALLAQKHGHQVVPSLQMPPTDVRDLALYNEALVGFGLSNKIK